MKKNSIRRPGQRLCLFLTALLISMLCFGTKADAMTTMTRIKSGETVLYTFDGPERTGICVDGKTTYTDYMVAEITKAGDFKHLYIHNGTRFYEGGYYMTTAANCSAKAAPSPFRYEYEDKEANYITNCYRCAIEEGITFLPSGFFPQSIKEYYIPDSVTYIDPNFTNGENEDIIIGATSTTIYCSSTSYAAEFAEKWNFDVVYTDEQATSSSTEASSSAETTRSTETTQSTETTRSSETTSSTETTSSIYKPAKVTGVQAVNAASAITVSWNEVPEADGYQIYRKTSAEKSYKKVKTVAGGTLNWNDTDIANGAAVSYKVRAYSGTVSNKGSFSDVVATMRLNRPTISSCKSTSAKKTTVKWKKNSKATGYQIWYKTSEYTAKTVTIKSKSTVKQTLSGLKSGKTYTVKVRSYKKPSDGNRIYSAWSASKKVAVQ